MIKKHILVVSQYFYPEEFRINDICKEWIKKGYKVTVVTGIPNYPKGSFYNNYGILKNRKEKWNGINIIRLPIIPRGKNAIGLILNYLSFVISGFFWSKFTRLKADLVFNYEVSPMTQVLVGNWYAKSRRISSMMYLTDIWPDNVQIVTGINNKFIIGLLNRIVNNIYKNSDVIFTSSKSFKNILIERNVKKDKIYFWPQYAEDFYKPMANNNSVDSKIEIIKDDRLNIVFAGNIGYAQGLNILIDTCKKLKVSNTKVRFNLVGDGRYKDDLIKSVKQNGYEEFFMFYDKVKPEEVPMIMADNDIALICLDKSEIFSMTIPAKTQSCMACAMPILVAGDGEISNIIEESGAGLSGPAQDSEALYTNILKFSKLPKEELSLMREKSLLYYKENYDKKILLKVMDEFIERC